MALEQAVLGAEEVGGLLYTALLTLLVPLTLSEAADDADYEPRQFL